MLIAHLFAVAVLSAAPPSVDHWVGQLASARWQEREAASQQLFEMGKQAVPALQRALDSQDPEVRHRAHQILDRLRWQTDIPLSPLLASSMRQFPSLPEEQRLSVLTAAANELRVGATPLLCQVMRTDPSEAVRGLALRRLISLAPQTAEAELRQLTERQDAPAWAAAALGDLLTRLGKENGAIAAYESVRKLNPKDTQAALALARIYERRTDWAKARDLYAELTAAQPDHVLYRMNLGRCFFRLGQPDKAEAVWRGAIDARGAGPNAFLWLANAYQSVGAPDKALTILREGAEKNPNDVPLIRYLASMLSRAGKTDEAIATYEKALRGTELEQLRRATGFDLAYLLRQSGQLDAYLARQKADPAGAQVHGVPLLRRLAEGYLEMREEPAAASVLHRLRTLYPQSEDAKWAAETLKRMGEKE